MKTRMHNTFVRIIGDNFISYILKEVGYAVLLMFYVFARLILKSKRNCKSYNLEECEKLINDLYKNPIYDREIFTKESDAKVDLSIVMPVYNVEKYVEHSIKSIVDQTTKYNYELIIVNDGSKDGSDEIVKKFDDRHIKYIIQENQGLSGARNTGINNSVGKYIMFVDSDDVMTEGSIDKMMDAIIKEDADIVVGGYYMFQDNNDNKNYQTLEERIVVDNPQEATKCHGYAWGKIYKRNIFDKIRFPYGAWYEDTIVCNVIFRMVKKVIVINQTVYGYRINPSGISRSAKKSIKCIDHYWVMEDALKQAKINGLPNDKLQYELTLGHMSGLLYRRLFTFEDETIEAVFAMARALVNDIRPEGYVTDGNLIRRDIENAFIEGNYKLWKLASFVL